MVSWKNFGRKDIKFFMRTSEVIIFMLATIMLIQFFIITFLYFQTGKFMIIYTNEFGEHYIELFVFSFFYIIYVFYAIKRLSKHKIKFRYKIQREEG